MRTSSAWRPCRSTPSSSPGTRSSAGWESGTAVDRSVLTVPREAPWRRPRSVRVLFRPADEEAAAGLSRELRIPLALARVLAARGFDDPASARRHLSPSPDDLHDPFAMAGMSEAVDRL